MPSPTTPDDARPADPGSHDPRSIVATAFVGATVGLAVVGVVALATSWWWPAVVSACALVPASAAAAIDLRTRSLPDLLVASCAAVGVFVAVVPRGSTGLVFALLGAVCIALPLLAIHIVAPNAMGFGDIKFGAALGTSVGSVSAELGTLVLLAMISLAVSSAVGIVEAIVIRRRDLAYGPALVVGVAVALVTTKHIGGLGSAWR